MGVPINNVTRRVVYAASGTGPYNFTFEILAAADIAVYRDDTLLTLTTDYTVTINANGTGSITLVATPTGATQIAIVGNRTIQRTTDFVTGGDFFANTLNDELDQQTIFSQQNAEGLQRALTAPQTDPTTINMTLPRAALRANKTLGFDGNGNPTLGETLGTNRGNWASGTLYYVRDIVKDTSNNNIWQCLVQHTSTGSQPISTNADAAKWSLLVDSGTATDAAAAAAISEANAAASELSANEWATKTSGPVAGGEYSAKYHAQAAATSASNASTSASNAASAQSAAEAARDQTLASFDSFDDRYLGAKTSDPAVDNDGNALVAGALYFNSTDGIMKVYTGSVWVAAYVSGTDFLVKANNLSDLPNTGTARTNLGGTTVGIGVFTAATAAAAQQAMDVEVGVDVQAYDANLTSAANRGLFRKADPTVAAFTKTGNGTATTSSVIYVEVNGNVKTIASGTSIAMPTLIAGTDYAIWAKTDGTLEATSNHTSPPTANARKIGGFHYAPGGNATAQSGGNTTAQINAYSMWDLKWRPACPDPRGMTLVAGGFWADIYLTGVDAITNGSSKYNVTMADGSSPPKVPTDFGGNGSTTYGSYTWFEAQEFATAFGKKCPTQMEFMSLAYGTTEASSVGSDQVSTILNAAYTSKWGVMQSAGVLWVWARDRGGPAAAASWNANTEGRGSEYNAPNAGRLGGNWADGSDAGSRCSGWVSSASVSSNDIGSRFVCDHLQLD